MKLILPIFFICLFLFPGIAGSEEILPLNIQAAVFFKIFNFTRSLTESPAGSLKLAILPGYEQEKVYREFEALFRGKAIGDKKIEISRVNSLENAKSFHIVYIPEETEANLDINSIVVFCEMHQIMSISGVSKYSNKGVIVCLGFEEKKPKIIINRTAARKCGVQFSPFLMKLVKVVY